MAFEPQRFIHAANVRLDVPVSVQTTENFGDNRSAINLEMPLRELMRNFFDDLKICY